MNDTAAGGATVAEHFLTEQERDLLWRARNSHETRVRARTLADEELVKLGARPVGLPPYEGHIGALLSLADEALTSRAELVALRAVAAAAEAYALACDAAQAVYGIEAADWGERMGDAMHARQEASDALCAAVAARQPVAPDPHGAARPAAGTAAAGQDER